MVFNSVSFLIFFLPSVLLLYFLIPKRYRAARNGVLLLFSLAFYAFGGAKYLLLLLLSILINYLCGLYAASHRTALCRKTAVVLAVALNLGLLGWFKYSGFAASILNSVGLPVPIPQVVLPIGISFFTFQGLSYVIDVSRGDAACQKNPFYTALYIALFPQLVAGPIVRYTTIEREIISRDENLIDFSDGLCRFLFGLSKKVLLANAMGEVADPIFALAPAQLSTASAWVGAAAYTMQIYFDFSSYSDMAIGLGRMFGFHFLENFNYPYIAASVSDFWHSWHISLTTWFRDYLYSPLGGSRCAAWKHVRNIVIVWLLTGLWHGASWNFVVWGLWFCVIQLGEKFIWGKHLAKLPRWLAHTYTMLIVIISWIFFRAPSLQAAGVYLAAMFGAGAKVFSPDALYYLREYYPEFIVCLIGIFPLRKIFRLKKAPAASMAAALALLVLTYMKLLSSGFQPFIYFQF